VSQESTQNIWVFYCHFNSWRFNNRTKLDILIEFYFFQVFLLEINIYSLTGSNVYWDKNKLIFQTTSIPAWVWRTSLDTRMVWCGRISICLQREWLYGAAYVCICIFWCLFHAEHKVSKNRLPWRNLLDCAQEFSSAWGRTPPLPWRIWWCPRRRNI
jgi:hypothetical protein